MPKGPRRGTTVVPVACLAAIVLAGCASSSAQPGAVSFFKEHGQQAARVGGSVRRVEAEVRALSRPPTKQQLTRVAAAAEDASERISELRNGWSAPENIEGEELSTLEAQLFESSGELKNAMAALVTYSGDPRAAQLVPYTTYIKSASEKWNEGVTQLWYVVKAGMPPTIYR